MAARSRSASPTLADRQAVAERILQQTGGVLVHPYDDAAVIAGQGTLALEFHEQTPGLEFLVTPVSGGGLISGLALATAAVSPGHSLWASNPNEPTMPASRCTPAACWRRRAARPLRTACALPGERTFAVVSRHVREIIAVSEAGQIVAAMRLIWERLKIIVEASSAVVLAAGALKQPGTFRGRELVGSGRKCGSGQTAVADPAGTSGPVSHLTWERAACYLCCPTGNLLLCCSGAIHAHVNRSHPAPDRRAVVFAYLAGAFPARHARPPGVAAGERGAAGLGRGVSHLGRMDRTPQTLTSAEPSRGPDACRDRWGVSADSAGAAILTALLIAGAGCVVAPLLPLPSAEPQLRQAAWALVGHRYEQAEALAQEVLQRAPDSAPALLIAGDALAGMQRSEEALAYYRRVPDDGSAASVGAHRGAGLRRFAWAAWRKPNGTCAASWPTIRTTWRSTPSWPGCCSRPDGHGTPCRINWPLCRARTSTAIGCWRSRRSRPR